MNFPVSVAEWMTVTKDAILTIGALVGMVVAILGLSTWRRQLKGGAEYDLTRRLLKRTYQLREAVASVRFPIMHRLEMEGGEDDEPKLSAAERKHMGLAHAYQARWNKLAEAHDNLQTELLEAEVLWGATARSQYDPLFALEKELFAEIQLYVALHDPSESLEGKAAIEKMLYGRRSVRYDTLGSQPDPYADDLAKVVTAIEGYLKPRLSK